MAQRELEPEVITIFEHIDEGKNFLLSGGAGSGKTYSLVHVIKEIIDRNPTVSVACMTYTNAAVKEIDERVNHDNLQVSTIHDFLWDNIKSFQKELKKSLIELMNDTNSKIKNPLDKEVPLNYFDAIEDGIQYKEYLSIKDGIISHDEVLMLANHMFKTYTKLCDILKDKFKYILIDEYQDTSPFVVEIFLTHLEQSNRENIIGFFGDAMQSIYDDGIGDLNSYLDSGGIVEVKKEQNRRNPRLVIELANKVRTDGLIQVPSTDGNAPNMQDGSIKEGNVKFYYTEEEIGDLDALKTLLGWDFNNTKEIKELNLTHSLIASKAGFQELMDIYDNDKILDYKNRIKKYIKVNNITIDFSDKTFGEVFEILAEGLTGTDLNKVKPTAGMQAFINENQNLYDEAKLYPYEEFKKIYVDKDALIDDKKKDVEDENKKGSKRDSLIKHLFKIQTNIRLYQEKKYNEFLRKTEYIITQPSQKNEIKEFVETLSRMGERAIEEIIEYAHNKGIAKKDDKLERFIIKNRYLYNRVVKLPFSEFQNLYNYLEGYTPFSTQHKIKGAEFSNVLVVLDNGGWNQYNFEYLMNEEIFDNLTPAKQSSYPRILSRTQKIFYVCCTRAKENLAVFYNNPSEAVIEKAKEWFDEDNVQLLGRVTDE